MNIYLASSHRNPRWEVVKRLLEQNGHKVFDWKADFTYTNTMPDPDKVTVADLHSWFRLAEVQGQLAHDLAGIAQADVVVILLPCGNDAHTEMGIAFGAGIPVFVLSPDQYMRAGIFYGMAKGIYADPQALVFQLNSMERAAKEVTNA